MLERLKARKAEIARLREERGATDPILIIAGIAITLILLVGGSFAISGFIANANDLNAKGDLDRVATAQAAYLASNDRYGALAVGPNVAAQNTELQNSAIGFTPTAGNSTVVRTSADGWVAATKSASGKVFVRTSESAKTFEMNGEMGPDPDGYTAWTETRRNLIRNPSFENDLSGVSYNRVTGARVAAGAASGDYSLALTRTADANTDAYADIISSVEGGRGGTGANSLKPSTTYTITATYTLDAPFTSIAAGATTGLEQKVSLFVHLNGTQVGLFQGVNTAGTRTLTGAFTTPAAFTGYNTIRLYGGDTAGSPSRIKWDSVGLFEGTQGAYMDGSSTGSATERSRWTGAENSSTSVRETRSLLPGAGQVWLPSAKPADLNLPAGISWDDVSADLRDVNS
jgi:hypothetical protein